MKYISPLVSHWITALDSSRRENFESVIKKAITACEGSNQASEDHFHQVGKMVEIGTGAKRSNRITKFKERVKSTQ